jgi:predicted enzyme related to lactoylglutathione lyase
MAGPEWHAGLFVWHELMTDDVDGARRFYGELFGWSWATEEMPVGAYSLASTGGRQVAGLYRRPEGLAGPPAWVAYPLVEDVDAATRRCRDAGGRVLKEPADIPRVGRFSVIADPWGAVTLPFRSSVEEPPPPPGPPPEGSFCWETLITGDVAAAVDFYERVIGFGRTSMPGSEVALLTAGPAPVADVQASLGRPPAWISYVAVAGAMTARDRAAALGAKVLVPRIDAPGVGVISFIADPGGAPLGLFEPARR